ncbi:Heterokaryon incompatibility protein 6, OR allele [Fusarium odoratissimum]|uniref:Heterokaryon incompatibility protein 6, OR allele n=1 Tax=Fusarium oxysporum f. sp. cubense (strain race 4) TaxID=2502994 RepID=N1RTT0_FUSC4|nr:Heterokaryon incompatibility protein 6, OR allele [Fusarium odoratissimum]
MNQFKTFDYGSVGLRTASTEIRLLDLYPSQGLVDSPLIDQDGEAFIPITESLETALRYFRKPDEVITLWIDQICINQADNKEKGQQVAMMRIIYSAAKQVLVWLGPAQDGSDELMGAWQDIGQKARDFGLESYMNPQSYSLVSAWGRNKNPADETAVGFQDLLARTVAVFAPLLKQMALKKWFERPYFSRVWIIQEFCLCPETIFVLFVELETNATEHRDRVFALLGLAVDVDKLGIEPDYEKSTEGVLTETARALIEESGRIDVLCFSQFPKLPELSLLPTWVPDWRSNLRRSFYTVNERMDRHLFTASRQDSVVEVVQDPDNNPYVLGLRGYTVDVIEAVAQGGGWQDMSFDHEVYLSYLSQIQELWQMSMKKPEPIHGDETQQRKEEARWRVPIADIYWTLEADQARATSDVAAYHKQFLQELELIKEMVRMAATGEDFSPKHLQWQEEHRAAGTKHHYQESMSKMQGKRPFLTKMGYLGMGPIECKAGDTVAIFCGGRIPFVLRPVQGSSGLGVFSYIGEAYCDGVMDGQVTGKKKQTFWLT